jgi:hypothetical protein
MVTLKILPYTNVTLTFGWITLFMGDMGEGALHREERKVIVEQRKLKPGHGPHWGHSTKMNWPTDRRSQYNLSLRHCTANCKPALSSERVPYMKKKEIVTQRNVTSGHPLQKGHDTKTNWPTDRRSQYNLNLITNAWRYNWATLSWGGYKYKDVALQVGGISDETVIYGYESARL